MSDHELAGIVAGFGYQVILRPDATALIWNATATYYGELGRLVIEAEQRLADLHLPSREPIGLLVEKSPAAIALVLACLRTRRPFLLPSPKLDATTLERLFEQSGCRVTISGDGHGAPRTDWLPYRGLACEPSADISDVSFMLTTSGSTGLPKIVPIHETAVARFITWAAATFDIRPGTTVLNYAPLNFDLCLLDVWTTLARGGRVVLVTAEESVRPALVAGLLTEHRVQMVQAVPMCFALLADVRVALPSVTHLAFTGDAIPQRTLAHLPEQFPNARLFNIYGCTETNDSFVHELEPMETDTVPVSIGAAVTGVDAYLIDDGGAIVRGPGQGELLVSTPFQTRGYLDAARNVDKFVDDPTGNTWQRFFRTGDIVRRDGRGRLTLIGRSDHQVKVRGVAVNTAEIERVLLEHPHVDQAVVVAVNDPVVGHRLVCAVTRTGGSALHSLELRKHCARRLPNAAIPSSMTILDQPLPTTSTGKPDRRAIAASTTAATSPAATPTGRRPHAGSTKEEIHHVQ
jgi:acyl-coenzyme A synthetase/AMP-(fatty) acid ligase